MSIRILTSTVLGALCAVAGCMTVGVSGARAAVTHNYLFGFNEIPASSGAVFPGSLGGVDSLTVDTGHLWIAEPAIPGTQNSRVDRFDAATGKFISEFAHAEKFSPSYFGAAVGHQAGGLEPQVYLGELAQVGVYSESGVKLKGSGWTGAGTPAKSFQQASGVAVDNSSSPSDWAAGDVYVADRFEKVVSVFKPDAEGNERYVGQLPGVFEAPNRVVVNNVNGDVLVADETAVDVFEPTTGFPGVYTLSLKLAATPTAPFSHLTGVAVDVDGDIYVANNPTRGGEQLPGEVAEFSAAGVYRGHITGTASGPFKSVQSVAIDPATHDVYVGDYLPVSGRGVVDVFGPGIVIPDVTPLAASSVKPQSATLNGTVNLDNEGPASCRFVYGTTKELGLTAPCVGVVSDESGPVAVHSDIAGLQPDTTYFYRLQATNKNGTNPGEPTQDVEFTTSGPGIRAQSVSDVAASSATLEGTIDPHGAATSYFFEYGTGSAYGHQAPSAPGIAIGAAPGDVNVAPQHLDGLAAGTVYHYRLVAVSELEVAPGVHEVVTFNGADGTFTTQPAAGGTALPDGRQWELVSPPEKNAASILGIGIEHVTQAAAGGQALTFLANAPTEAEPPGYGAGVQVLAQRGPAGWRSKDIASPHTTPSSAEGHEEYKYFTEDLSLGFVTPNPHVAFSPLSPEASEKTPYLHSSFQDAAFCSEACFRPLVTGKPGYANVPPQTTFGQANGGNGPGFVGANPDASHVILQSDVALTPGVTPGLQALYEWSRGHLALVSVLPGGAQSAVESPQLGFQSSVTRHAVSDDGSRIVWSQGVKHLFMRDMLAGAGGETVQLDAVQGGTGSGEQAPQFQMASPDDSRVFFTDPQRLTESAGLNAPNGKEGDLYECKIVRQAGKLLCDLTDLTPEPASGKPAKVLNVVPGASEDGSTLYFVADAKLAPGAVEGTCTNLCTEVHPGVANLYVWHEGAVRLVAVLGSDDTSDWNGGEAVNLLTQVTARVSPDGRWLAFMSDRSLTGYDTRDLNSGQPVEEVYLYDRESGRVVCASCDPTGARPLGHVESASEAIGGVGWGPKLLAGFVPGWTSLDEQSAPYQSRYLLNSGRMFFNSVGPLVPGDANGVGDVYQFEPAGIGDCSPSSTERTVVFVAASSGCVGLISSGKASEESQFLDASAGGEDVFFLSAARLSPQDVDSHADVYDAHECTAAAPCFPSAAGSAPPACDSADSCKAAPSSQPEIFAAPASSTFSGSGNPSTPAARPLTRAKKLARALKACRSTHSKRQRKLCEKRARARFGPAKRHTSKRGKG